MTLYLKYRPQKIKDLDLTIVRESLANLVNSGNIPHALLFAGPKGTGKTSAARIIAKIVNCEKSGKHLSEPCDKCNQCISIVKGSNIDVIEIDAASHRGIDDVRLIRDAVKLAPINAKKKVYIVDEAHMLTTEASNALLKTLEEPPDHVIFILATTNPEKLIPTVRSRVVEVDFNKASSQEITASLTKKAKGEKVKFENDALKLIAEISDGSFRDATKILEELVLQKIRLKTKDVASYISMKGIYSVDTFVDLIFKKKEKELIKYISDINAKNIQIEDFINSVIKNLRDILIDKSEKKENSGMGKAEIIEVLELLFWAKQELPYAYIDSLPLEIAVYKYCAQKEKENSSNIIEPTEETNGQSENEKENTQSIKSETTADIVKTSKNKKATGKKVNITDEKWRKILDEVRPINMSVEALLRAARPLDYDGQSLVLGVYYKFHKEKLEEVKNIQLLELVAEKILLHPTRIVCHLTEAPKKEEKQVVLTENANEVIDIAKKIFES